MLKFEFNEEQSAKIVAAFAGFKGYENRATKLTAEEFVHNWIIAYLESTVKSYEDRTKIMQAEKEVVRSNFSLSELKKEEVDVKEFTEDQEIKIK